MPSAAKRGRLSSPPSARGAVAGEGLGGWIFALACVGAEFVGGGGTEAGGEVVRIARGEPGEQGCGDDGDGNVLVDGGLDRPAPFAGVLDIRFDRVQVAFFVEGVFGEL